VQKVAEGPVIVDPSLALGPWGTTVISRLDSTTQKAFLAPTLASIVTSQRVPHPSPAFSDSEALAFAESVGLSLVEVRQSLRAWAFFAREDVRESQEMGGDQKKIFEKVVELLGYAKVEERTPDKIFVEQVAMAIALASDGGFVLARCASTPWFWRWMQKKGFVPCKELTAEDWLKDEVAIKKEWLRTKGLHHLAWEGVAFAVIHVLTRGPAHVTLGLLRTEGLESVFGVAKAIYFDP
jgi:hypothetical protein